MNRVGQIISRHSGRGGDTGHLDEVLSNEATMDKIVDGLRRDKTEDARPGEIVIVHIDWASSLRFGGITYEENWHNLTLKDLLGAQLYRVAFMVADHAGRDYILQDA